MTGTSRVPVSAPSEDQINASETIMLCCEMVGAIAKETSDGSVSVDLYSNDGTLEAFWQDVLDQTTLEVCDECHGQADEYGLDMPIRHADTCTAAP